MLFLDRPMLLSLYRLPIWGPSLYTPLQFSSSITTRWKDFLEAGYQAGPSSPSQERMEPAFRGSAWGDSEAPRLRLQQINTLYPPPAVADFTS